MMTRLQATILLSLLLSCIATDSRALDSNVIDLGTRRELFVDDFLIDSTDNVRLVLNRPRDEGVALKFDKPWEGFFCGYATVIKDGDLFRMYYRGRPDGGADGDKGEVCCCAESSDGILWTKPELDIYEVDGHKKNNVVLADEAPVTHNFSPMLDSRPGVPDDERYKALGGIMSSGLSAWKSPDGLHWERMQEQAVITTMSVPFDYMFDSQNLAFWSDAEEKFLCFFRVVVDGMRRIARAESDDFLHWSEPVMMEYRHQGTEAPLEHLYTNQTSPYFRAPHIYVSIAARFMPGRQVLTDEQAEAIQVNPKYFKDTSDAILMTTRGGNVYDRTFLSSYVRPAIGAKNWVSRTNYPALNVVQTGPTEMSVYLNQDYAQPTSHMHRYSIRLDGFASAQAPYSGGELVTKPFTFKGNRLSINFATSAAGGIRVEIQDAQGKAIPGFALEDAREQIGNEIDRAVSWNQGDEVSSLAGKTVRLRFEIKDADLYSLQFQK